MGHRALAPDEILANGPITLADVDLEISITAPAPGRPSVVTGQATDVTGTSATLHGTLHRHGTADEGEVYFEYGEAGAELDRESSRATIGAPDGFSADVEVTGLSPETGYEYRAAVEAAAGDTARGDTASFETFPE